MWLVGVLSLHCTALHDCTSKITQRSTCVGNVILLLLSNQAPKSQALLQPGEELQLLLSGEEEDGVPHLVGVGSPARGGVHKLLTAPSKK